MEPIEKLRKVRLEKLEKIRKLKIDPFPAKALKKQTIGESLKSIGKEVTTAGRIMAIRSHGGSTFMDLADESAKIQLFLSQDKLSIVNRELLTLLDIGDFIQVRGRVGKTQAGETTIFVSDFKLLTKSLRPIPQSFYGLKDIETRLRKRHLDLIVNPEVRELFIKKTKFWQSVRQFLLENAFLEVETPALEQIPGGADARPFITRHHALNQDFYLRISLELYQKRLLVGGFEKIFEIGKVFRNEGIDSGHLQDYLQMEFYWAYADYEDLMDFTQKYYQFIVYKTLGTSESQHGDKLIDWSKNWPKIDYLDSFKQETGMDLSKKPSINKLYDLAEKVGAKPTKKLSEGRLIDLIYKKAIRPKIIQPTFLINHPILLSPLAKKNPAKPQTVQRVQVIAAGTEVGNGFSELNDPQDQKERFEEQQRLRKAGDEEAQMYDQDFVEALEYGMPPAAGFGLSQRLFAVLVDKPIRETVFFPTVKPGNK
ncbi:lysine--tRNA ligase [Candidatus Curtissbacteria bacterium RIFCSPHIGHO2_01_FULL_41_44]|uniref:Lysine--tRNA ligase n=1 Tax=Candidatus Curtissbacteria bacterium RIFCSPLOWO2_01_FULL_42_50 TaxID=1797730 RepID=A0A1F5H3L4_9BACT|nr:MAG: lysine--tRNA ligase [Candidatus Curtissbacteria bacterium RIFCSPHIGHO2_01_FULL_41_44]OGD94464.1 MAG: lysine--tRNA ligase [Candidatus Curtissbacteria bacterium RIFCSPHIGHO2_02_FULL_42_58]OGD97539.1 MAG: lysine--tRNA ligase [Candidatus Curtissbacteria bacterium RIFCSPHIGHO2_12_FULL_42_33]OGD98760.1 MAG: lysine--tRNA ligase [Candidatus Curtissbacteria bacterium RIFCSPLOWO2_01_FULL_42_50]OGE03777.1 MAG: lysine--tRNA ligase [Candidatus Curtissbacteria bacterium RIFCSPLOWO2_12_FULL_41_16]OGE